MDPWFAPVAALRFATAPGFVVGDREAALIFVHWRHEQALFIIDVSVLPPLPPP